MRKQMVAGNWKMNLSISDARALVNEILQQIKQLQPHHQVVFCVPFTHIATVFDALNRASNQQVMLGAQNCHEKNAGAFTGEVSSLMLREAGVSHVIIGHSERRQYFGESHELLREKVDTLIANAMQVIFCCGEPLDVRNAGTQNDFVARQLRESLFHLSAEQINKYITIAYEPIWAIGTGVTASTEQAQEMHAHIRKTIREQWGDDLAENTSILYGGSCNAQNAKDLFSNPDVDGGLIGGASLKAESFLPVIHAMN